MILKINQIYKLFLYVILLNICNLYAHNYFNGSCKDHCDKKIKSTINENFYINKNYQKEVDNNYSCLNKSLCRG